MHVALMYVALIPQTWEECMSNSMQSALFHHTGPTYTDYQAHIMLGSECGVAEAPLVPNHPLALVPQVGDSVLAFALAE